MQKNTTQKISRTATATILATSTIAVGLPTTSNGAVQFKDIKKEDYYYAAVLELANNQIVNGYPDGTFRPNKNVTRGEAAKMLALSLNLDVSNAETSMFKDVKKSNIFYKYIAALANKGIINGYPDGNFKPDEIVQRGAMAKMVALGYEFSIATKITHPFRDVSANNIFNPYIQTLLNLEITQGTSAVTFSPEKPVTRGQLATFISRANKADAGKPKYIVDNVVGNKIYINSVGYTVAPALSYLVKPENKSALLGAYIEGTFNGTSITALTKLTFNATGTQNSIYTFDGGNSTFNGTVEINGSYLRFQNWTLNGQTIVAETPRKSLAKYYTRLANLQIAGLTMANVIDFTKPTNPDDGILNGGNGELNSGNKPTTPYNEKLKTITKYVDFTNVTIKNLIVEQDGAYVKAQKTIPTVTIRRDVKEAELQFNMRNLYLDGDMSLQLYGTHDIETVYKNTYYSIYFNTDSHIRTLILDNSYGWVNLGTHVTVDKAIIPPGVTPNDVFDDYKNDTDQIGKIEDNSGKDVDRDPIENGVVPDVTPPILTLIDVVPDSNYATVSVEVNEPGILHYLVLPENEPAPTTRGIVTPTYGISGKVNIEDSDLIVGQQDKYAKTLRVNGLDPEVRYKIYLVHVDNSKNFSGKVEKAFATKDGTPPAFITKSIKNLPGGRRLQFDFKPSEQGQFYYFIREAQNVDSTVSVDDVIANAQDSGNVTAAMVANGHSIIIREDENGAILRPVTRYVIYAVLVDNSGNKILKTNMFAATVTTDVLDETPPYVTGPSDTQLQHLIPVNNSLNQFYIYFSEKLDKASAENVNNYSLSGTGIINIPGQQPIKPTSVKYEDYQNRSRVLITIPSLTGFINNDTLRVTVSPDVMDLAENKFESLFNPTTGVAPRNYAQYTHNDTAELRFTITNIERAPAQKKAFISYNTTKAGQIYYMLLPNSFDISGIRNDEFVAEFGPNPTSKFGTEGNKAYLERSTSRLNPPYTTEKDDQLFTYDYSASYLNPVRTESYSLYMVLRDRSGNLSSIEKALVIADEDPPRISSFDVLPVANSDTSVAVTLTSENEGGSARIGYFEKYILDRDPFSPTHNKYILNPAIYNSTGNLKQFGTSDFDTNAQKILEFESNVPNFISPNMNKGTNTYTISGLDRNKEYVFYAAVLDEFGNFTAKHVIGGSATPMIKGAYTDGIVPSVLSNLAHRTADDQVISATGAVNPNNVLGQFEITFTETIGRVYADQTQQVKTSLNQTSVLSNKTTPDLTGILRITDASNTNITSKFDFVSYTIGSTINSTSKLVIRANDASVINKNFAVEVLVGDQQINPTNKTNFVADLAKYISPLQNIQNTVHYAVLQPDSIILNDNTASTKMNVRLDLGVPLDKDNERLNQYFYYAVVNDSKITTLTTASIKEVIEKADRGVNENLTSNIISYGRIALSNQADLSNIFTLTANPSSSAATNVFATNHNLFIFTKDKYGNIIWAKQEGVPNRSYISIQPKGTTPTQN